MTRSRPASWSSRFAALLAVALLTYAGVASTVMQVRMGLAPTADCSMANMAGMPAIVSSAHQAHGSKAALATSKPQICPFCADAAHAPLVAFTEPLRPPSSAVFVVAAARPPLGARAPPSFQPRARGPPSPLQTA